MPDRTLTTDATARRETMPDLAKVEATAIGEGDTATVARKLASDRAATIQESVTAVAPDQIHTIDLKIEDETEPFGHEGDAKYLAKERLKIECVPETAETIVVEVTDAGGTVQSVHFQIHQDVRRQLQDEALAGAMERAREKAERLATVEGMAVADVLEVTTREVDSGMESIVDQALEQHPDRELSPEPVAVSEGVEVVYELTEA